MGAQQQAANEAARFVMKVNEIILVPLISLLMGLALLFFLYGAAQFIINAGDENARATGRQHMLWGIIGIVVMIAALAIIRIAAATFGLEQTLDCATNPNAGGCSQLFRVQ
jgi:ABC-type thiamin/hydroxymethylpyrimidine transport system permease subunit